MADLQDIRYVRLGCSDLEASVDFATRILGLEIVDRERGAVYLRGDDRDHNICYLDGEQHGHAVGFEVASLDALDIAAAELDRDGVQVRAGTSDEREQRRVRGMISFTDPTGNRIELVARPSTRSSRYFPSRDAGVYAFSHIGLRTVDPQADEGFWTRQLGARVSDWIGDAALLRIDDVHHKVALFPAKKPGIQHVNFQVATHDDVMRSWYFLKDQGVRIAFGPGRHPTSGAKFLYFYGPDGMIYEYSTGVRTISPEEEADYRPRQFKNEPASFCMWGSLPDIPEFAKPAAAAIPPAHAA